MKNDFVIETMADAFLALSQISDEEALDMLKVKDVNKRKITEGKAFSVLNFNSAEMDDAEKFMHGSKDETELEVIDVDADTVEHIKDNEAYVGQAILCCNKCKAKRFIDLDKLVPSEEDPDTYNIEDECPHCKTDGVGFELIGQVGKVEKEEEVITEPTLDNDNLENEDGVTFDNDYAAEPEEEAKPEEPKEEKAEETKPKKKFKLSLKKRSNPEEVALDDTSAWDTPKLGEAFDPDQNLKESTDDVYGSLNINEETSKYAEEAWMMNKVISSMNNEEAYYGSWLYIWPDEETREECEYDFGDEESFEDLKSEFIDTYKYYHDDGLYAADEETEAYAHKWDDILGLAQIENTKRVTRESLEEAKDSEEEDEEEKPTLFVSDFFNLMMDPEEMENITVDGDECSYDELPMRDAQLASFDVADSNLVIDITKDEDPERIIVSELLNLFSDEETEKINLVDAATTEEVFVGTKADAIDKFGDWQIAFVSKPEALNIVTVKEDEEASDEEPVEESLFERLCKANNLHSYKANRYNTEEYWLRENLKERTDLAEVYEQYCVNDELRNEFKATFDFKDNNDNIKAIKEELITSENCAVVYGYRNNNKPCILDESCFANTVEELDSAIERVCHQYMVDEKDVLVEYYPTKAAYMLSAANGWFNASTNEIVANPKQATLFVNEDLAHEAAQDVIDMFGSVVIKRAASNLSLTEGMSKSEPLPVINEEVKVEETKEPITEKAGTLDLFERVRELAAKLGINTLKEIEDYGKAVGAETMDEIADSMEAEIAEREFKEETPDHVIATDTDGQTYVSVDGGNTWEQCSQEEFDELYAGGYKEVNMNEGFDEPEEEKTTDDYEPALTQDERAAGQGYESCDDKEGKELTEEVNGISLPLESVDTLRKFARVALDTCKAVKKYYNIDVNVAKVIADMFSDLNLLDPDFDLSALDEEPFTSMTVNTFDNMDDALEAIDSVLGELVGSSYVELSPEEIRQISDLLDLPEFTAEKLDASVASEAFIEAAEAGEIPYIDPNANLRGTPMDVEIVDAEEDDSEPEDEVEVEVEAFDKELNDYFKENYDTVVFYHTEKGSINEKGQIVLEGYVVNETTEKPIVGTLTPMQPLSEALATQEDVAKALGCTEFKAENNLSEEVFKFNFKNDTPNTEIFDIKEEEKVDILNKFVKQCKDCQKYLSPKELVHEAAVGYGTENRAACEKLGMDICNVEAQLATVVDQVDLTPAIENAEPEK